MSELTPEIAAEIVAACQAGLQEINEALSRTLDVTVETTVGEPGTFDLQAAAEKFAGPGLLVMLTVGPQGALLALPEESGLLPEWYVEPDATGESKLTTLAQELGMLVLPETLMAEDFRAQRVDNLYEALERAEVAEEAVELPLELAAGEKSGTATMIWPAASAPAAFGTVEEEAPEQEEEETAPPAARESASPAPAGPAPSSHPSVSLEDLPAFARSLLRVQVPVMVTLASRKSSTREVLELGPGSIIQFDKSCEEMLDLEVAGHRIGHGEAVKVGDKFGLRITSIILPDERFQKIQGKKR